MLRRIFLPLAVCAGLLLAGCSPDYGTDQNGKTVAAAKLDGQWLVVNYWAEWCGPCRTEIPQLNALAQEVDGQGVAVVGVNFDNLQGTNLKQAADAMGIRFTVLANDPALRFDLPSNDALPITYIIDGSGKVRERLLGEQTADGLKARLKALKGA